MFFSVCKVNSLLALAGLVYIIACVFYMVRTRSVGTPFLDSLNEEQMKIRMESAGVRRAIFYQGLIVGVLVAVFLNPFKAC